MITRSFDLDLLLKLIEPYPDIAPAEDFVTWFNMPKNLMFVEGDNLGLATYELPGIYNTHWYFKVRGRKAINLAQRMLLNLFDNYDAKIVRGLVKTDLKASRWGARQVGFKSYGILPNDPQFGECELFMATREDVIRKVEAHG